MNRTGNLHLISAKAVPVYELVDKDGTVVATNVSAQHLGLVASQMWPDQEQDEDRTGKGWDVQVAGCDR